MDKTIRHMLLLILTLVTCTGCQAALTRLKPVLQNEGEVYVYLQSLPADGGRLGFTVDRISAVTTGGFEVPLTVKLAEVDSKVANRQRLIASGAIPPGDYDGFTVTFKEAHVKTGDSKASLLLQDKPVRIGCRFAVADRKALLATLSFKYDQAVTDDFAFTPSFTADIPGKPLAGLAGYVTNRHGDSITVFDKKTGEAMEMIETGRGPSGIALDQLGRKAYVALSGEDAVEVIDLYAEYGFSKIKLNPGDEPRDVALTPDGRTLLVANAASNTVSIIDPAALIEVARVRVGTGPGPILIDRAGQRAYVFNTLSDNISAIDIGNKAVSGTITTEAGPFIGMLNRRGDRLYVLHEFSPYMLVLDPRSFSVMNRVFVGMGAGAIKVDPLNDQVYVGKKMDGAVDLYDPFSLLPGGFIPASGGTTRLTMDGELNNLILVHADRRTVEITNLVSRRSVAELDAGDGPYQAVVSGER